MGLHERDYYREDYAEKNGMRYNSKNATYRAAPLIENNQPTRLMNNEFSLIGKIFISLLLILICAVTWRYFK